MHGETYDRREAWKPAPRPEWMAKLNALGEGLDVRAIIPLKPESLIAQAIESTGLEDFGEGDWRQHLEVLAHALDDEADLHFVGRLLTRCELLMYLQARLRMVAAAKTSPEIVQRPIDRPLFITGYARSGTTILFEVLAQDPQFQVVTKSEALFPCAPSEVGSTDVEDRNARAASYNDLLEEMTPEFKSAHKSGAELPVESLETEYPAFLSDVFTIAFQIPSYARYLKTQDLTQTLEWQKLTLQVLQSQHQGRHWLMKSPSHLPHLRKILQVFPDMRVIFTHRDPLVTADSVVSVMGTLYWLRTDNPWGNGGRESWSLSSAVDRAAAWDEVIALIESGDLPRGRFANFHYAEFMTDPMASIRKIYDDLDMQLLPEVEQNMLQFLEQKTKGKFGKHEYELTPHHVVQDERNVYARYEAFFGVMPEISE